MSEEKSEDTKATPQVEGAEQLDDETLDKTKGGYVNGVWTTWGNTPPDTGHSEVVDNPFGTDNN